MKKTKKKRIVIAIILVAAPLARFIAMAMDPVVKNTLLQIGQVLIQASDSSPIVMGLILGGLITVVATAAPQRFGDGIMRVSAAINASAAELYGNRLPVFVYA